MGEKPPPDSLTGSGYEVELFDVPPPRSQWDAVDEGHQRLYTTFLEGLAAAGQGLTVQRLRTPAISSQNSCCALGALPSRR